MTALPVLLINPTLPLLLAPLLTLVPQHGQLPCMDSCSYCMCGVRILFISHSYLCLSPYPDTHPNCAHTVCSGRWERLASHRLDISVSACLCVRQALAQAIDSPCLITRHDLEHHLRVHHPSVCFL